MNAKKLYGLGLCLSIAGLPMAMAQKDPAPKNEISIKMQKIPGFGPDGVTNMSILPMEDASQSTLKNIPVQLKDVHIFKFSTNHFQEAYQNYKQGKLSRSEFVASANLSGHNLKDTVNLSTSPMPCALMVALGKDEAGNMLFVADANQNNDLSDDVIRPLPKRNSMFSNIESITLKVNISYFDKGKVRQEPISVIISDGSQTNTAKPMLSFAFPEFRFAKFNYKNTDYIVCIRTNESSSAAVINVLPDRPYFAAANRESRVKLGGIVNLGGDLFTFKRSEALGNRIVLVPQSSTATLAQLKVAPPINLTKYDNAQTVAAQYGFLAPEIKGQNLHNGETFSLASLKGKYVFVDFWSTSCVPCIEDFPKLKMVYEKFPRNKVEFVSVADERVSNGVAALSKEHGMNWPTVISNNKQTLMTGYNIAYYPSTYLIDPTGKIINIDLKADGLLNTLNSLLSK